MALLSRLPLCAVALLAACGGGTSATAPNGTTTGTGVKGTMTATVNGAPWKATFTLVATVQNAGGVALVQIAGSDTTGVSPTQLKQLIVNVGRSGALTTGVAYPLDVASTGLFATAYAGQGQYTQSTSIWSSYRPNGTTPGGGTMTITTLTATRVAGTFAFTAGSAAANPAGSTGALVVTNGAFDVPLQ